MSLERTWKLPARKGQKHRSLVVIYGLVFSGLLFFLSLLKPSLNEFLDNKVYDTFLSTNTEKASPTPLIVDIEEKSLRQYGQWPWPRYQMAILLEKLGNLGALSIGLDMLFAEEDRTSITAIKKGFLNNFGVNLEFTEVPQDLRDNDRRLADTISKANVVLGYQFLFEEDSDSGNCLLHPLRVNKMDKAG